MTQRLDEILNRLEQFRVEGRCGDVPLGFARHVVQSFPEWFDFADDKFAMIVNGSVELVVAGNGYLMIPLGVSRCISCLCVWQGTVESARMDLGYHPDAGELANAKTVISLALRRLFPQQECLADDRFMRATRNDQVFPAALRYGVLRYERPAFRDEAEDPGQTDG